jgi:hypothetical protein
MIGLFKKESCCVRCEELSQKSGDLIKCRGVCQGSIFIKLRFCRKAFTPLKNYFWANPFISFFNTQTIPPPQKKIL